jgi:hypothetical protein
VPLKKKQNNCKIEKKTVGRQLYFDYCKLETRVIQVL